LIAAAKPLDVALASCVAPPEADPDEALLVAALAGTGISSEVVSWDDPRADFGRAKMTLLRSTWNYPQQPREFLLWLAKVARISDLWNPLEMAQWNFHKGYLLELEGAGIPIAPTALVKRGANRLLSDVMTARDWRLAVVKPAVSANSFRTVRVADVLSDSSDSGSSGEAHLRALTDSGDVLVQQYLPSVEEYGERALIWIDGQLTHGVRKSARFAGEHESVSPGSVEIAPAEADLAARAMTFVCGKFSVAPMYARVDVAPGPAGTPVLMELELIEPSLYFGQSVKSLERFVAAVRDRL